jgi:hypothetical protein
MLQEQQAPMTLVLNWAREGRALQLADRGWSKMAIEGDPKP